ncbi:MAG: hypothetical protein KGJ24_02540 [Burkholderiales bacterium]|nr:hypothetical protein [Burkholderiales bacterium]
MNTQTRPAAWAVLATALLALPALAGPWIPPAGTGTLRPALRLYRADRDFPATRFGTALPPGTTSTSEQQLKVTGLRGLGGGWALSYDLRAARIRKTKTKKQVSSTASASGLQDQVVGLVRGLRQGDGGGVGAGEGFADALALNLALPAGSATSNPQLGTGHLAIEPDYLAGARFRLGHRPAYASVSVGPRVFFNSHVTQWRATLDAGARLTKRVGGYGNLFWVRTFGIDGALAGGLDPNASEQYNLLRAGVGLQWALSPQVRPRIGYEADLRGRSTHAGRRLVLALALRY